MVINCRTLSRKKYDFQLHSLWTQKKLKKLVLGGIPGRGHEHQEPLRQSSTGDIHHKKWVAHCDFTLSCKI